MTMRASRNYSKSKMSFPAVTLGDLITDKKLMWTYCLDCGRERDVDPAGLPLPPETPIPGLGRRHMRCRSCASRKIETRPELYPGGLKAARLT